MKSCSKNDICCCLKTNVKQVGIKEPAVVSLHIIFYLVLLGIPFSLILSLLRTRWVVGMEWGVELIDKICYKCGESYLLKIPKKKIF